MSLRAIKKRENQLNTRQTLYKKSITSGQLQQQREFSNNNSTHLLNSSLQRLEQQRTLLGRATHSNPELRHPAATLERFAAAHAHLTRTKSESDVSKLLKTCAATVVNSGGGSGVEQLVNAKSEVCLQTIASHSYQGETSQPKIPKRMQQPQQQHNMLSRSHRDLTRSDAGSVNESNALTITTTTPRRMSECSYNSSLGYSGYSQRTSAMSASASTLSSAGGDSNAAVMRIPIIGYEVMEERARFTVYKLRVENPLTNDCWLVLRRYTDFVRLNTKLKLAFPHITLYLPRKKIFGDNFNSVFLDNRVQGLQMFVNSIMAKEELRKSKTVRDFFCLDEPPTYSESMEECRAIFEAQEETIAHLKLQINNKNDLILSLQQKLRDEMLEKEELKSALKNASNNLTANGAANAK